jgi:membrane protein DedA with SNARE-associated domain
MGQKCRFAKEAFSLLAHFTDILTQLITNLYVSTGLLGIVLAMAIESCCIPLPSEIVMPVAGILLSTHKLLAGTNSAASLLLVALAGAVGCLIGSIAAYGIGYGGGRPLMLRYGRYVLISQHDADKADAFFQRWGSATAFFSRLLPVVRTYISLPAGISKMSFRKFCLYSFLGSFPWCLLLAYLGTILGNNLATLSPIFHSLDVVIAVVLVVLIALYVWRHIRNDRKARAAHAVSVAQAQQTPQQMWAQSASSPQQVWGQQPVQQPQWGQRTQQPQPGWNAPSSPQLQQPWSQQPAQTQPGWGQQSQSQQEWRQQGSQLSQGWEQSQQPSYPPQQGWPPQADDDRTVWRR